MDWKDLSLLDIRRLVAMIEQTSQNPDAVRAIVQKIELQPMPHDRVTLGTLVNLLNQLGNTTVLPEEVLALLRRLEPALVEPPTGPVIDCDAPAIDIENASVLHHHHRGQIVWDPQRVEWCTSVNEYKQICEPELAEQPTMNMCAMEYLRNHQQLIPPEWQSFKLFFPGTTYHCAGTVYVPFLYYEQHCAEPKWKRSFAPITNKFEENDVILLYPPTEPAVTIIPLPPTFDELIAACRFDKVDSDINETNFPLTDDGTTGPIEELKLKDISGAKALQQIQDTGLKPIGMRRALEYVAQHREDILRTGKDIAIVGAVCDDTISPVILTKNTILHMISLRLNGKYSGASYFLVTRE